MGDLVDWSTFVEKYNAFVGQAKYQFHVHDFDEKAELDKLAQLREKMIKGGMIVDSIEFMNQAMNDPL